MKVEFECQTIDTAPLDREILVWASGLGWYTTKWSEYWSDLNYTGWRDPREDSFPAYPTYWTEIANTIPEGEKWENR